MYLWKMYLLKTDQHSFRFSVLTTENIKEIVPFAGNNFNFRLLLFFTYFFFLEIRLLIQRVSMSWLKWLSQFYFAFPGLKKANYGDLIYFNL